jgi:hypothetical protein
MNEFLFSPDVLMPATAIKMSDYLQFFMDKGLLRLTAL